MLAWTPRVQWARDDVRPPNTAACGCRHVTSSPCHTLLHIASCCLFGASELPTRRHSGAGETAAQAQKDDIQDELSSPTMSISRGGADSSVSEATTER